MTEAIKYILLDLNRWSLGYWGDSYGAYYLDILSIIFFYLTISYLLKKVFLWDGSTSLLTIELQWLKKSISRITDLQDLNILLKSEIHRIYKARDAYIKIYPEWQESSLSWETQDFFKRNPEEKVFINDVVFIEKYKEHFSNKEILHTTLR